MFGLQKIIRRGLVMRQQMGMLSASSFSTSNQQFSELYKSMKYDDPEKYLKVSPLITLREVKSQGVTQIDMPSYEMLFRRFTKGDWGSDLKQRPKKPFKAVENIVEFITLTNLLGVTLNREQLCVLVMHLLGPFIPSQHKLLMPYARIKAFLEIAKAEQRTCKMIQSAFIDELEDLFKDYFDHLYKDLMPQLESPKSCV